MKAPSEKRMVELLGIQAGQAQTLREMIHAASGRNHDWVDGIMSLANSMTQGFDVEAVRDTDYWDSYYCDIKWLYVNTGETYQPTLIYNTDKQYFIIGDQETMKAKDPTCC